jgi:hypothetical protein
MTFEVLTICGSMRYYDRMLKVAEELTGRGYVVLMPFVTTSGDEVDGFKEMLDRMHRQKIDMSSGIMVVTDRDTMYIGESTNAEITYAIANAKSVEWALQEAA